MGALKLTYQPEEYTPSLRVAYKSNYLSQREPSAKDGLKLRLDYYAEFWMYDSRLGRRWEVDPITYPWQSSYAAFNNNPVYFVDPLGLEGTNPDQPPTDAKQGDAWTYTDVDGDKWDYTYDGDDVGWVIVGASITPGEKFFSRIASFFYAIDLFCEKGYTYDQKDGYHFYYKEGGGDNENAKAKATSDVEMVDADYLTPAIGGLDADRYIPERPSLPVLLSKSAKKTTDVINEVNEPNEKVPNNEKISNTIDKINNKVNNNIKLDNWINFEAISGDLESSGYQIVKATYEDGKTKILEYKLNIDTDIITIKQIK